MGVDTTERNRAYALYYAALLTTDGVATVLNGEIVKMELLVAGVDSLVHKVRKATTYMHWIFNMFQPHLVEVYQWMNSQ